MRRELPVRGGGMNCPGLVGHDEEPASVWEEGMEADPDLIAIAVGQQPRAYSLPNFLRGMSPASLKDLLQGASLLGAHFEATGLQGEVASAEQGLGR